MRLLRGGAQVEHQRTQQVGGERPDLQRIQQDHEAACKGRMEHPQHGRDEAEQEIDRFGDGRQRRCDRQRQDGRSRALPALLFGSEDERRRDAQIAERFGEAGVHPDDVIGQGQAVGVFRHRDRIGSRVGHRTHRHGTAQRRELERHIDEMVQAGGDEQPFEEAIQKNARMARSCDPARHGADALLQGRPDKADRHPERRRKSRDAQERPPQTRIHLRDKPGELRFAGAVKDLRSGKAQQDAARHTGVHDLDAQDARLTRGGKAGQTVGLGQAAQDLQRRVVGRQEDEIGHEGQQCGLLLFGAGARSGDAHAEEDAEVVDDRHHAVVQQPARKADRRPVQHREQLAQRAAGEQCPHHQQQARRRQIRQRVQKRLRDSFELLQEFLHLFVLLSGMAHRPAHFILRMNYTRQRKNCQSCPKAKITVKVCTICTGRVEIRPAHDN